MKADFDHNIPKDLSYIEETAFENITELMSNWDKSVANSNGKYHGASMLSALDYLDLTTEEPNAGQCAFQGIVEYSITTDILHDLYW